MRLLAAGVALVFAGAGLSGCTEVETEAAQGYLPSHVEEIDGSDLKRVTLTEEGARRTGLETARVRRAGRQRVVPYASLIYDGDGKTWVYTSPRALHYERAPVVVDRVDGARALLRDGPAVGTTIVTTGAIQVYGSELEIGGDH
jgi:hypothetical protein